MSTQPPLERSFPLSDNLAVQAQPTRHFLHQFLPSSPASAARGVPSCWVTIYRNATRHVVLITAREEPQNSISDCFHEIATQIKDLALSGVAPDRIAWIEHHPKAVSLGRPKPHPTLDLPDLPYTAKVGGWQFHSPRSWTRISREHLEQLAGGLVEL